MVPSASTRYVGVMLPVAIVCSMVAMPMTVVALRTWDRIMSCPS